MADTFILVEVLLAVGLTIVVLAVMAASRPRPTPRNKGVWMWDSASDLDVLAEMLDVLDDEPFQVIPGENNSYVLMVRVDWELRRKLQRLRVDIAARSARRGK